MSSSTIRAVDYDLSRLLLQIEFHRGGTYEYSGVPEFEFEGLIVARSKGKYFNDRIQGRFRERKIRS